MTLLGVGHALVDAFAFSSEDVPKVLGLHSGTFNTVPDYRMKAILLTLENRRLMAGGSSANIVKLAAQMGVPSFFVSRCGNDDSGSLFESELLEAGVRTNLQKSDGSTGICVTFLTPSGDRTIATFRSASEGLPSDLVSDAVLRESDLLVLEGYLLDDPGCVESLVVRAKAFGKKVAFDTSDVVLVDRHRDKLLKFLQDGLIHYLFAQEAEAASLAQAPVEEALAKLAPQVEVCVIKRGEQGCIVCLGGQVYRVAPAVTEALDTTGSGDAFEAGFFWGLSQGLSVAQSCDCGTAVAGIVMKQPGTKVEKATMQALVDELSQKHLR